MTQPEDIQWYVNGSELHAHVHTEKRSGVDIYIDPQNFTWRATFEASDFLELRELAKHTDLRGAKYDAIRNVEYLLGDIQRQVCPVPFSKDRHDR